MEELLVDSKELGERIRTLRTKQNKTQAYFADILYISPSYLALIEAGKRIPNLEVLVQITKVTDVTLDYLVFGNEQVADSEQKTLNRLRLRYSPDEIRRALRIAEYYLRLSHLKDCDEEIRL